MNMKSYLDKINSILRNDSDLWKLLYHESKSMEDNPLDKDDILQYPPEEKIKIMNKRLKHTPTTDDLVDEPLCRIIFYPSTRRTSNTYSYLTAMQEITFDVFVHKDFNDTDMRLAMICDHLNDLIFNEKVSGLGRVKFRSAQESILNDIGYIAYSMTYEFGSVN